MEWQQWNGSLAGWLAGCVADWLAGWPDDVICDLEASLWLEADSAVSTK